MGNGGREHALAWKLSQSQRNVSPWEHVPLGPGFTHQPSSAVASDDWLDQVLADLHQPEMLAGINENGPLGSLLETFLRNCRIHQCGEVGPRMCYQSLQLPGWVTPGVRLSPPIKMRPVEVFGSAGHVLATSTTLVAEPSASTCLISTFDLRRGGTLGSLAL